jgi:two-component system chemotaxis sensor kinase CheA
VQVSTLDRLMTVVSELVLTRNQLIEIGRRRADNEFKTPLQRLSSITAELQEGRAANPHAADRHCLQKASASGA